MFCHIMVMRNVYNEFLLTGLIMVGGLWATKAKAQMNDERTQYPSLSDTVQLTEMVIDTCATDSVPPRTYTPLEAEFQKYLDKAMPNNVRLSYEDYIRERKQICIADKRDESVTMVFHRTDGTQFSIHYTLVDANHNGIVDGIAVNFDEADGRKDVVIPYKHFGRLYDMEGTCMSIVTHAVLDLNPEEQSCDCKMMPLKPLEARAYPSEQEKKEEQALKLLALRLH